MRPRFWMRRLNWTKYTVVKNKQKMCRRTAKRKIAVYAGMAQEFACELLFYVLKQPGTAFVQEPLSGAGEGTAV